MYTCIVCDQELFSSTCKYDSGCGWPAFFDAQDTDKLILKADLSHGESSSSAYGSIHSRQQFHSSLIPLPPSLSPFASRVLDSALNQAYPFRCDDNLLL